MIRGGGYASTRYVYFQSVSLSDSLSPARHRPPPVDLSIWVISKYLWKTLQWPSTCTQWAFQLEITGDKAKMWWFLLLLFARLAPSLTDRLYSSIVGWHVLSRGWRSTYEGDYTSFHARNKQHIGGRRCMLPGFIISDCANSTDATMASSI